MPKKKSPTLRQYSVLTAHQNTSLFKNMKAVQLFALAAEKVVGFKIPNINDEHICIVNVSFLIFLKEENQNKNNPKAKKLCRLLKKVSNVT